MPEPQPMIGTLLRLAKRPKSGSQRTTYRDRYAIAGLLAPLGLPLARIFFLFGSDKQSPNEHSYGAAYAGAFGRMRLRRIKLLEIGLLGGASLLAWRCYFPFATTIGVDIEPKFEMAGNRTRIYQGDQSSAADLDAVAAKEGPFDIIIDDGSHINAHQLFSFGHLFPHLKEGGVYVIEDVQTSYWPSEPGGPPWGGAHLHAPGFAGTCIGEFLEVAKYLNHAEFLSDEGLDPRRLALARQITRIGFEHNLIFIWKGRNEEVSNAHRYARPGGMA